MHVKDGNEHSNGEWPGPSGKGNCMAPSVCCSQLESLSNFSQEKKIMDLIQIIDLLLGSPTRQAEVFVFLGRKINNRIISC